MAWAAWYNDADLPATCHSRTYRNDRDEGHDPEEQMKQSGFVRTYRVVGGPPLLGMLVLDR
jgi:hypothetical protein